MITVHYLNNSRAQRVLWCLEELGVPYQIEFYERNRVTMRAPDALKQVHSLGKSPIITDRVDGKIRHIAESGAIIDYLVRTYGEDVFIPRNESLLFLDYQYWMHFSEGSLMPPLLMRLIFSKIKEKKMPFPVRFVANKIVDGTMQQFIRPEIKNLLSYIEQYLSKKDWFVGNHITGADFQMSFPLEACKATGLLDAYPNICRYVEQFQSRDAYLTALTRASKYDFGPMEKAA